MVLATDDEDILEEAVRRGIETYETEDVLEEAARTIGAKRSKEILADIINNVADKNFRELNV